MVVRVCRSVPTNFLVSERSTYKSEKQGEINLSVRTICDREHVRFTSHYPTAAVAKKAYAEGRAVKDVAQEMTDLSADELDRLLDPAALTEGGIKN